MIEHNIIEINGIEYRAEKEGGGGSCSGCHIKAGCCVNVKCESHERPDNTDVIYKQVGETK